MQSGWEVTEYSEETFAELLQRVVPGDQQPPVEVVADKLHSVFLREYLPKRSVRTVVVEYDYVDRDFLEDYAAYYVRCFREYPRSCTRLHFFSSQFDEPSFRKIVAGADASQLVDNYCGFIVVRPLPETIIGRTCLSFYDDAKRRHFPTARDVKAQLFGIDLNVSSLPFQEQDTAVSRCATSALWSVFHACSDVFGLPVPSPVEITRAATRAGGVRALPNNGLTLTEVAIAIKANGLEPLTVSSRNLETLKTYAYSYLRAGIAPYFSFWLVDPDSQGGPKEMGRHAVAITGFSLDDASPPAESPDGVRVRALRIDKLYVHDDGVGPFARMEFRNESVTWNDDFDEEWEDSPVLGTSWRSDTKPHEVGSALAVPNQLVVPHYHKVRVHYRSVYNVVSAFDRQLEQVRAASPLKQQLEWDIFLSTVSDFRRSIRTANELTHDYRTAMLTEPTPRFVWRAIGRQENDEVVELLFDATDLEQGSFLQRCIEYSPQLGSFLRQVSETFLTVLGHEDCSRCVFEWFKSVAKA